MADRELAHASVRVQEILAAAEQAAEEMRLQAERRMQSRIAEGGRAAANRMQAAEKVSRDYYNQRPELLQFVLSKPPDRVTYSNLRLARQDFEQIEALGREAGILDGPVGFDDYADTSFSDKIGGVHAPPSKAER